MTWHKMYDGSVVRTFGTNGNVVNAVLRKGPDRWTFSVEATMGYCGDKRAMKDKAKQLAKEVAVVVEQLETRWTPLHIETALRARLGGDVAAPIMGAAEITLADASVPTEADYEAAARAAETVLSGGEPSWGRRCAAGDAGRDVMYQRRGIL